MLFFTYCDVKGGFQVGEKPLLLETKCGFKEGGRTKRRSLANGCCCCSLVIVFSFFSMLLNVGLVLYHQSFSIGFNFSFAMNYPGVDLSMTASATRVVSFVLLLMDSLMQLTKKLKAFNEYLQGRESD